MVFWISTLPGALTNSKLFDVVLDSCVPHLKPLDRSISIIVSRSNRRRLAALLADRNAPQKHDWRAEMILFTADGLGKRDHAANSQVENCVWLWQECFV